jgi:hypothetical protein
MSENHIHPELEALCVSLDTLAKKVVAGWSSDQTLQDNWGWDWPALDRHSLGRAATEISDLVRKRGTETVDESILKLAKQWKANIAQLTENTIPNLFDSRGQGVHAYLATLSRLRGDLEPILGWQAIRDANLLPPKMARRLRAFQAELDQITPNKEELQRQMALIREATSAAESLPTDLEALTTARKKIEDLQNDSLLLHGKISERLTKSEAAAKRITEHENDSSKLVSQCEEAYRITTTKGLAAAFDQRANSLNKSMWIWVVGLVGALTAGYFLGAERLKSLAEVLNSTTQQSVIVWPNAILAFFSLGAPIWLAWIATKQIGQRFRLAEDYAFKASVAKAYEGYRKEAARIDEAFEARLFSSALTRLE